MSAQLIELLIFAAIAFLVISKLISTLGSTSGDEPTKRGSYFGETANLKDVTNSAQQTNIIEKAFLGSKTANTDELNGLIVEDNKEAIVKGFREVLVRLPQFKPSNFLRNAKNAFRIIIESGISNKEDLATLVDKRYLDQFKAIVSSYGNLISFSNLDATISEIYMFGNNAFIKILFTGQNVTTAIGNLREEWTFTKSLIQSGPDWYLSNVDRPQ
jgi:predicted lipid-binding transport protein (Tim44 family)